MHRREEERAIERFGSEKEIAKRRRAEKRNRVLSLVAEILLFLLGIGFLLYPATADYINVAQNEEAIVAYRQHVNSMDFGDYTSLLEAAKSYNEDLFRRTPYIGDLTRERRKVYESLLNLGGTGIIGYVEIEKIDVYLAIYHGTGNDVLQNAIGHVEGSSLPVPGESVHTVISGHSGLPSARLFTDVDQLEVGDRFTLHVLNETYVYEVESCRKALPEELKDMRIEEGKDLCTLMTCTPYGVNTHRLLVTGHRIETPSAETSSGSVEEEKDDLTVPGWDASQLIAPVAILVSAAAAAGLAAWLLRRKRR